jgi:hypothetical protein
VDPTSISAESQTGYKWSFAANKSRVDNAALQSVREQVGAATWGASSSSSAPSADPSSSAGRSIRGPTLPSSADLAYARELASESAHADASLKRKRDRAEAKERVEDMVGPREVGREGALEKKRARREADRSFRERGDDGLEADEGVLLGGGDSFKAQCVSVLFSALCALTRTNADVCAGSPNGMPRRAGAAKNTRTRRLSCGSARACTRRRRRRLWPCSRRSRRSGLVRFAYLEYSILSVYGYSCLNNPN